MTSFCQENAKNDTFGQNVKSVILENVREQL